MKIEALLDLINSDNNLMELTGQIKAELFRVEDVEPIETGARIILAPTAWGDPDNWGSNRPQRRTFDFQINVESSDLALSLDVADALEELFMKNKINRMGSTISENVEYLMVIARRYRFSDIFN